MLKFLMILLTLTGCTTLENSNHSIWVEVTGRDAAPMYRLQIPSSWNQLGPEEALLDTTKANARFNLNKILITIHTFPTFTLNERIHPSAQVQRWLRQFSTLEEENVQITENSQAGYAGLILEAEGIIGNQPTSMIAMAMQLDPSHFRVLESKEDFTIKAIGPTFLIKQYKKEILSAMTSFELIHGIEALP